MRNIPQTGLSQLGAVLADAGQTYQRNARQDQLMTRQRGQQLEDVQSARDDRDRVRKEDRTARLDDEAESLILRQAMTLKAAMIAEGILDPAQSNNPDAVAVAWGEMQRRQLDKVYGELLSTPGPDGRPMLTQDDLMNPSKVAAAKDALGQLKARQIQFSLDQQGNAQTTVDDIQKQLAQVRQRSQAVAARIDQPAPHYGPADQQVLALAAQLAEQAKPGSGRNREAISAMVPMAQKQLNDQALMSHAQQVQSATRELETLRYTEAQMTNALREAMQTFKVAPKGGAMPAALQSPGTGASAPKAAGAADIAGALEKLLGGGAKPGAAATATAPSRSGVLENPTSNPTIARGNAELERRAIQQSEALLNGAIHQAEVIERQLQAASGPTRGVGLAPGMTGGMSAVLYDDPVASGQKTADLLKKKAANDARILQLRAQLEGPVAAGASAPVVNTPTSSAPMEQTAPSWWRTMQPAPAF